MENVYREVWAMRADCAQRRHFETVRDDGHGLLQATQRILPLMTAEPEEILEQEKHAMRKLLGVQSWRLWMLQTWKELDGPVRARLRQQAQEMTRSQDRREHCPQEAHPEERPLELSERLGVSSLQHSA